MITKTAIIDAAIGFARANNLSDEQKKAITDKYKLDEDAWLRLRNAGRGALGGFAGNIGGTIAGGALSHVLNKAGVPIHPLILPNVLGVAGTIGGAMKATDKYSVGNAEEIMKAYKAKAKAKVVAE